VIQLPHGVRVLEPRDIAQLLTSSSERWPSFHPEELALRLARFVVSIK